MYTSCLCVFFSVWPGIGDLDGPVGCSFHHDTGFLVDVGCSLSTVRFVAHQQYFKLLDIVDQELLKP